MTSFLPNWRWLIRRISPIIAVVFLIACLGVRKRELSHVEDTDDLSPVVHIDEHERKRRDTESISKKARSGNGSLPTSIVSSTSKLCSTTHLPLASTMRYEPISSLSLRSLTCDGVHPMEARTEPYVDQYVCQVLAYCDKERVNNTDTDSEMCSCFPKEMEGDLSLDFRDLLSVTWSGVRARAHGVQDGGHWRPSECAPRRRVAVIVPYRDRERHLRVFLSHYHRVFQGQKIEYRITVVEQEMPYLFNKASLMNAGFLESQKTFDSDCILFLDVDTIVERGDNIVICGDRVLHWAGHVNRTSYNFIQNHFGAGVLLTRDQFIKINGYSNIYWGWGGEDDDFLNRVTSSGLGYDVGPRDVSRFQLMEHKRDVGFDKNSQRYGLSKYSKSHPAVHKRDGLSTVQYEVISAQELPLYTRILIRILRPDFNKLAFSAYKTLAMFAYRKKIAEQQTSQFTHINGTCGHVTTSSKIYYKSETTCKYLCDTKRTGDCYGFEYFLVPDSDSYCVLLNSGCVIYMNEPGKSSLVYIKDKFANQFKTG